MQTSLTLGDAPSRHYSQTTITLGCASDCDFPLPALDGIHNQHARLRLIAGRWLIEACGDWQLKRNASEAGNRHWLESGDSIQFVDRGPSVVFKAFASASNSAQAVPAKPKLSRDQTSAAGKPSGASKASPPAARSAPPAASAPAVRKPSAPARPDTSETPQSEKTKPQPPRQSATTTRPRPPQAPASPRPRKTRSESRRLRRLRQRGSKRMLFEISKVLIGALIGMSIAYYIMCMHMPDSVLLKMIGDAMPEALKPEAIRGAEIPAVRVPAQDEPPTVPGSSAR